MPKNQPAPIREVVDAALTANGLTLGQVVDDACVPSLSEAARRLSDLAGVTVSRQLLAKWLGQ